MCRLCGGILSRPFSKASESKLEPMGFSPTIWSIIAATTSRERAPTIAAVWIRQTTLLGAVRLYWYHFLSNPASGIRGKAWSCLPQTTRLLQSRIMLGLLSNSACYCIWTTLFCQPMDIRRWTTWLRILQTRTTLFAWHSRGSVDIACGSSVLHCILPAKLKSQRRCISLCGQPFVLHIYPS